MTKSSPSAETSIVRRFLEIERKKRDRIQRMNAIMLQKPCANVLEAVVLKL